MDLIGRCFFEIGLAIISNLDVLWSIPTSQGLLAVIDIEKSFFHQ